MRPPSRPGSARPPAPLAAVLLVTGLLAAGLFPAVAGAQDTHYWNSQYGPKAMLLGGAIVGSVHDMSATYYNPGALGYIEDPELLLSANVYQQTTMRVEDGAGTGQDLVAGSFRPLPNMVAGAFQWAWLGDQKLAYSVITRYRSDVEVSATSLERSDVVADFPGEEDFAGGVSFEGDVHETWVGISWAPTVSRKVGFGVTPYVTIRSQGTGSSFFAQALSDSGQIALYETTKSYEASHYGLLVKAGMGVNLSPLTLGLTVTTPKIRIAGTGRAFTNETQVQLDPEETGTRTNSFTTASQTDLTTHNESPLSVAAGGAYHFDRTTVHASVEWFQSVDPYAVLDLEPFVSQGTGETVVPSLQDAAESVVNWGVGVEHRFGESAKGYLSYVTDQSSASPQSEVAVTGYDIRHLAGGVTFAIRRSHFTTGIAYAWGDEVIEQEFNLDPGDGSIVDPDEKNRLTYRRITFVLGFSVDL